MGPSKRRRSRSAEPSSPQRKFACEMDETFLRTFERPPFGTDSESGSDNDDMLVVPDAPVVQQLDLPTDPCERPVRLELVYGLIQSAPPSFGAFVRSLKNALPPAATIFKILPSKKGFLVETRYPNAVASSMQKHGWSTSYVPPPPSFVDVVIRGVHTAATETELFEDLQDHLGRTRVRHVRRLHAMSDEGPDRARPIPVIVATVHEDGLEDLRSWRVFGMFRPTISAKPRKPDLTPQCRNCYAWGHRSGTCKAARRCAVCGATSHLRTDCPKTSDPKRCFTCEGPSSFHLWRMPGSEKGGRAGSSGDCTKNLQGGEGLNRSVLCCSGGTDVRNVGQPFCPTPTPGRVDTRGGDGRTGTAAF